MPTSIFAAGAPPPTPRRWRQPLPWHDRHVTLQRIFFRFAYRSGRPRWDTGIAPPELVEIVEGPNRLTPGRALDLGCGTGTNALYLAEHGWEAVGVDFVRTAIERARAKAGGAARAPRFVVGDVTRLAALGVEGPFHLAVDIGCFHAIPLPRRDAYAAGVASVMPAGATLLIFAFAHLPAGYLPRSVGVAETELRRHLEPWFEILEVRPGQEMRPGLEMRPAWYRLMRRDP
jgi:SAM-dependent methyltransferase